MNTFVFRSGLAAVFLLAVVFVPLHGQTKPSRLALRLKATEYMRVRSRVNGFSGVVLVAQNGRPVFRQSYGMANREFNIPNSPNTKFRVGSVGKQFTSAAILLLEQRGRLQLSDPVSKYLSDWPKAWDQVTLHHLLSHTAGLPRLTTQALLDVSALSAATPNRFRGISDLLKPGEELQPLDYKPGENWSYSNVGYIVLSMVIEKVSGKSYCDFFYQEIFQPLGMANTGCEDPGTILKQRANGYTRIDQNLANASYVDVRFVVGAGSFYSTVDDLLLWNRALDANHLLAAATKDKLFKPVRNDYGYGWWLHTKFKRRMEWHGGNVSGFVSQITRYPEERLFIAILSNVWSSRDRSQVRAMANELAAMAFGEKYELPRRHNETKLDTRTYDNYVGVYTGKDKFAIAFEGNRLMFQFPPGQSVFEIVPESPTEFFWKEREYYLTFVKDDAGKVKHVVVSSEGEIGRWTKTP